jgi:hypothetical protein
MVDRSEVEAVEKILGKPIGFDISESAAKIKRNLMLVSFLVLVLAIGELETSNVTVFGAKLGGVTPDKLMVGLSVILLYTFLHYLWYCFDLLGEWSVRVTGIRAINGSRGIFGGGRDDIAVDPEQTTLYSWWLYKSKEAESYGRFVEGVDLKLAELEIKLQEIDTEGKYAHFIQAGAGGGVAEVRGLIRRDLVTFTSLVKEKMIPVSLERFDSRFKLLIRSQNLRVLLVDVIAPVLLALVAGMFSLASFRIFF